MISQWVYVHSKGEDLWTVGFYKPNGVWEPESDHNTADAAADRVHWLNGGERHVPRNLGNPYDASKGLRR